MVRYGFLDAKAGFGGFGLRLLVRYGFLDAKAGHSDRAARRVEESYFGFGKARQTSLLKKRENLRERGAFASGNSCFISSPVQKLKNSAKQNSWTVCRFSLWTVFPPLKPAFFFPNSAPLNSGALAHGV